MAVQWKFKNTAGGNVPADLENRIQTLETDNTTNKANIANNTTNITALQNDFGQWTKIFEATTGNIPSTEQNLSTVPTLTNGRTYIVKVNLIQGGDKEQGFIFTFVKSGGLNWVSSNIWSWYGELDYSTKLGDFKLVLGVGSYTKNTIKIAQPANQNVSVAGGFKVYIREIK